MTSQPPHRPELDDLLMAASLAEQARWRGGDAAPVTDASQPAFSSADTAEGPVAAGPTAPEGAHAPPPENPASGQDSTAADSGPPLSI